MSSPSLSCSPMAGSEADKCMPTPVAALPTSYELTRRERDLAGVIAENVLTGKMVEDDLRFCGCRICEEALWILGAP